MLFELIQDSTGAVYLTEWVEIEIFSKNHLSLGSSKAKDIRFRLFMSNGDSRERFLRLNV